MTARAEQLPEYPDLQQGIWKVTTFPIDENFTESQLIPLVAKKVTTGKVTSVKLGLATYNARTVNDKCKQKALKKKARCHRRKHS